MVDCWLEEPEPEPEPEEDCAADCEADDKVDCIGAVAEPIPFGRIIMVAFFNV